MYNLALALYNLAYPLGSLVAFPYIFYKLGTVPKYRVGLSQKLGIELPERLPHFQRIWFHAVSVGEALAVAPVVRDFRKERPHVGIYFSTTTGTGMEIARDRLSSMVDQFFYFPIDFYPIVAKVLDATLPHAVVIVETEIWPSFVHACWRRDVPLFMVNARISDASYRGYSRVRWFMKEVLSRYHRIFARSSQDAARLVDLGTSPDRIVVTGNVKFYSVYLRSLQVDREEVCRLLGKGDFPLWVCGSTHGGEEALVLDVYKGLLVDFPDLRLIIAPRHPERFKEVAELVRTSGFDLGLRSRGDLLVDHQIMLLDTMGELFSVYAVADVVFVGGSFVPVGGHNPLESLVFGKPTAIGPYYHNFKDVVSEMGEFLSVVRDGRELASFVAKVLKGQYSVDAGRLNRVFSSSAKGIKDIVKALGEVL